MSEISLNSIDSILDDFRDRLEEFINTCDNEDRCDLIADTAQRKISETLFEIEHEMELLHICNTGD